MTKVDPLFDLTMPEHRISLIDRPLPGMVGRTSLPLWRNW